MDSGRIFMSSKSTFKMPGLISTLLLVFGLLLPLVNSLASTDTIRDADAPQSGYLSNHNMDPAIVDSSVFGLLWKQSFNAKEQLYAKPLIYTPSAAGSKQLVFLASSQNYIRTLDAVTGAAINSRQVQTPFLQPDIGCNDIPNTIGITGTPVIDPATDTVYFFAKTYIPNYRAAGNTGYVNGVYYFYAVDINTLADKPGFPVLIDGTVAQNDPLKYFIGGVILQRPSLALINGVVYGGFGGHCDLFNYTGMVIGVSTSTAKVVSAFAMESGTFARHDAYNVNGGGGEAGIWMSGMGLATDGNRLFAVTGNGQGHQNNGVPATGRSGLQTLDEAIVNLGIDPATGLLSLTDYFEPYDYQNMDAGDRDLGSGGVALLDPATFSGTGVSRIGVTAGKNGKVYIVNADNLGGYRLGTGQTDGILQTIVTNQAVFGGVGSYPLEGGYIYLTPVGNTTSVYKLGHDGSGAPIFTYVGQSKEVSAGRVGVGVPTITTYNGQVGTAILWLTDVDAGLRAWYAVPENGVLKTINLPQTNGLNKFQRPAFGDGKVYTTDSNGVLYCLGSPVALPLNCSSPVNFGDVALGSTGTKTVTCTANIAITKVNGATTGDSHFQVSNSSFPPGPLAKGASFSFPVTWNLTNTVVSNAANASFGDTKPGVKSTALTVYTTNAVAGYNTQFPIGLTGNEVSQAAYLTLAPQEVDFGGLVLSNTTSPSTTSSFVLSNAGQSAMTILGYAWSDDLDEWKAPVNPVNATADGNGNYTMGHGFSSKDLPAVGSTIASGQSLSIPTTFTAYNGVGQYAAYFFVYTNGGQGYIILVASASTAPKAELSISTSEGGWLPTSNVIMDFGSVGVGNSSTLKIRICNTGGSVLTITKSKPPGQPQLTATAPGVDLHEGQLVPVGQCATGGVIFQPTIKPVNDAPVTITDSWTLNTDDLSFGIHVVQITGTIIDRYVGPMLNDGTSQYKYLGCYQDGTNGRLLPSGRNNGNTNENGLCQTQCAAAGYMFAGTEYQVECWCGNTAPPSMYFQAESLSKCTFACPADGSQSCGGNGGFISVFYDSTKYTPPNASSSVTTLAATSTTAGVVAASSTTTTAQAPTGTIAVPGNVNFTLLGCYNEPSGGRALSNQVLAVDTLTVEMCLSACWNYQFVGVEYGRECWCGNTLNAGSVDSGMSHCTMLCAGNQGEYCGNGGYLDLYTKKPLVTSTTAALVTTSTTAAAVVTTTSSSVPVVVSTSTTDVPIVTTTSVPPVVTTTTAAAATTTSVAPVITTTTAAVVTSTTAAPPVYTGPPVVVPGNVNFTLYSGASSGCVHEPTTGRALGSLYASDLMTIELCLQYAWNYQYAGVEYARECWYGNTLNAGVTIQSPQSSCNMPCKGNTSEFCGAGSMLTLYQKKPVVVVVSSSSSSVPVVVTTSSTTPVATSTSVAPVVTTTSVAPVVTTATTSVAPVLTTTSDTPVVTTTSVAPTTTSVVADVTTTSVAPVVTTTSVAPVVTTTSVAPVVTTTSVAPVVTASTTAVAVVTTTTTTTSAAPSYTGPPRYIQGNANFTLYQNNTTNGCVMEPTNGRLLTSLYANDSMTVEMCLSHAWNYKYAGIEYARECWYGNTLAVNPPTLATSQASCNMLCKGDTKEYCGAGSRLNLYVHI